MKSQEHSYADLLLQTSKLTYEEFLRLKERWLTSLEMTWLIQGHLTPHDALNLVKTAESSLMFDRISEEDVVLKRCVQLKPKTVY